MLYANLKRVEGVVADALAAGLFLVRLPDGESLRARISRRLRFLQVRVAVGDRVLVGMLARSSGDALIITGTKSPVRVRA
jgi:translation initiation factor IF-1